MIPAAIQSFCFRCRAETLHLKTGKNAPLYSCNESCGSPWKHITNPSERTPDAIKNRKEAEQALSEYYRKENERTSECEKIAGKANRTRYRFKQQL